MAQVASQKYFSRSLLEDQVVEKNGTPGEIRTPDPLLRRQLCQHTRPHVSLSSPRSYINSGNLLSLEVSPLLTQ